MFVKNWMSKKVVTVDIDDSIENAMMLLNDHKIRMLPVMKRGKLVGIVTDSDLRSASTSNATSLEDRNLAFPISNIKVKEIMSRDPITVPIDFTIEETAEILLRNKINGVPVVDHKRQVVGVITQTDLFKVIISLSGIPGIGTQFVLKLEDRPGSIMEICDIIRKYGGRISSILWSYDDVQENNRKVYFRVYGIYRSMLQQLKEELNKKAVLLYMLDRRKNKREVYEMP
ncbi:CBS and ACT domain-containing protein [Thermodesulfobacteriota bacterium]